MDDRFTFTVTDGYGGTNGATITLTVGVINGLGGQINSVVLSGTTATVTCTGIPGYLYNLQVATNFPNSWNIIWTTNAPVGGVFQFNHSNAPRPNAFYRLMWNGN